MTAEAERRVAPDGLVDALRTSGLLKLGAPRELGEHDRPIRRPQPPDHGGRCASPAVQGRVSELRRATLLLVATRPATGSPFDR
jgi:hypothetical protein